MVACNIAIVLRIGVARFVSLSMEAQPARSNVAPTNMADLITAPAVTNQKE